MDRRLPLVRCRGRLVLAVGAVAFVDRFVHFLRDDLIVNNSRCTQYA
jgi:hypothetical protein